MKYRKLKGCYILVEEMRFKTLCKDCYVNKYIQIKNGELIFSPGYIWDGSSIPFKKTLRFITFWWYNADKYSLIASLCHDGYAQLMRLGVIDKSNRNHADREYLRLCMVGTIHGRMSYAQAKARYKALRKFAGKSIKPRKYPKDRVYEI